MKKLFFLLGVIAACAVACSSPKKAAVEPLLILVSKDAKGSATEWIKGVDSTLNVVVMYGMPQDSVDAYLQKADGIILTGGNDINPLWYGKPEYEEYCETFDNYRDTLEMGMINYAMKNYVPVVGICRGFQLMNVANGGTMIPDIQKFKNIEEIKHRINNTDSAHIVIPEAGSWIATLYPKAAETLWINTLHHQAIDQIAPNFKVAAYSEDGIIESIELVDTTGSKQFAIGVQWHPELLRDEFSNFLGNIFLNKIKEQKAAKEAAPEK